MSESVRFEPNVPVRLALVDPQATEYDDDLQQGKFTTTDGRSVILPRPAVILLYKLEPSPGEEIQITRHLKGKRFEWTISLSPHSEQVRAAEEIAASEAQDPASLAPILEASIEQVRAAKAPSGPPVLLKRPPKKAPAVDQPRLFDRGTGTDGPLPRVAVPAAASLPQKTKYQDILLHICRSVEWALAEAGLQLGDGPKQDLISTVYIDASKKVGVEYDFTEAAR